MAKIVGFFLILTLFSHFSFGQDNSNGQDNIPFSDIFYKFGANTLNSFTYNYGVNYLVAGLGTYFLVHSGIDWEWSNIAYNNKILAFSGTPFGAMGFILPVAMPLGLYFYGRSHERTDFQITGLAMGQAAILGVLISSSIKTFTGRRDSGIMLGIINGERDSVDFSGDFAFGFMERGIFSGWPSSHTAVIFAMAVTLAELYPKNMGVKMATYSYAALTGIGMTLFTHWASDAVAGALIGYAIGKSVGKSYKELRDRHSGLSGSGTISQNNINTMPGFYITKNLSFSLSLNSIGINICY